LAAREGEEKKKEGNEEKNDWGGTGNRSWNVLGLGPRGRANRGCRNAKGGHSTVSGKDRRGGVHGGGSRKTGEWKTKNFQEKKKKNTSDAT